MNLIYYTPTRDFIWKLYSQSYSDILFNEKRDHIFKDLCCVKNDINILTTRKAYKNLFFGKDVSSTKV